jgi:hypothetical protein
VIDGTQAVPFGLLLLAVHDIVIDDGDADDDTSRNDSRNDSRNGKGNGNGNDASGRPR